jgi:hypothetical protein
MNHQALKFNIMLLMLKVSTKIQIHKSSVAQLQVVYKHTHKTSKFAFFNHHPFHPQAHSSSKKCVHLNHPHPHLFASVNKLRLFLNHPHSFFVKDHHQYQRRLLPKQLSVVWLLYQFHLDRLSSSVSHLSHHDHVISSLNVGSHTELKLNVVPLFNVLLLLNNINNHATLSSNTNQFKSELFVNSNALVLFKLTHNLTFNNTVFNFSMLLHSSNKPALLVSLKISRHQLVQLLLVSVPAHTVKKHSAHNQASKVVLVLLLEVLSVSMVVLVQHHHTNHQASHLVAVLVVLKPALLLVVEVVHHHTNHQATHLVVDLVQLMLLSLLLIPTKMVLLIEVNLPTSSVNKVVLVVVHPHTNHHHSAHQLAIKYQNKQSKSDNLKTSCYMKKKKHCF